MDKIASPVLNEHSAQHEQNKKNFGRSIDLSSIRSSANQQDDQCLLDPQTNNEIQVQKVHRSSLFGDAGISEIMHDDK